MYYIFTMELNDKRKKVIILNISETNENSIIINDLQ